MNEKVVKNLLANMKCGLCSQQYEPEGVDIVGHHMDLWLISVYCPNCTSRGLFVATEEELERMYKSTRGYAFDVEEKQYAKLLFLKWMYEQEILH